MPGGKKGKERRITLARETRGGKKKSNYAEHNGTCTMQTAPAIKYLLCHHELEGGKGCERKKTRDNKNLEEKHWVGGCVKRPQILLF